MKELKQFGNLRENNYVQLANVPWADREMSIYQQDMRCISSKALMKIKASTLDYCLVVPVDLEVTPGHKHIHAVDRFICTMSKGSRTD